MTSNAQAGISIARHKTAEDRKIAASACSQSLKIASPLLLDSLDDATNRAYAAFPDRLYLIDRAGKVVYKGGRGPFGYKPKELEQAILMLLLDEHQRSGRPKPDSGENQEP